MKRATFLCMGVAALTIGLILICSFLRVGGFFVAGPRSPASGLESHLDESNPDYVRELEEIKLLPDGSYIGESIPIHPHAPSDGTLRLRIMPATKDGNMHESLNLELTNISTQPLVLLYTYWPHQHVSLQIRNDKGELVSDKSFGNLMSVVRKPSALWLKPGESYRADLPLLGAKEVQLPAGTYHIEGVFNYRGIAVRSEPSTFEIAGRSN
jgi:hypothetical protein